MIYRTIILSIIMHFNLYKIFHLKTIYTIGEIPTYLLSCKMMILFLPSLTSTVRFYKEKPTENVSFDLSCAILVVLVIREFNPIIRTYTLFTKDHKLAIHATRINLINPHSLIFFNCLYLSVL